MLVEVCINADWCSYFVVSRIQPVDIYITFTLITILHCSSTFPQQPDVIGRFSISDLL